MSVVSDIKDSNIVLALKNEQTMLKPIHIEITTTNQCNGNCSYCFESDHSKSCIDPKIQSRQLELIVRLCESFDSEKNSSVQLVFWGGEPMMNFDFIKRIIDATVKYEFVQYFMYSNGTLIDKFKELISLDCADQLKERFSIQLSYDGEPHNAIKRGDTREKILETAGFLAQSGFRIQFKATLSFDMVKNWPEMWKSYEELNEQFNDQLSYSPTLDTCISDWPDIGYEEWKDAVNEVMRLEHKFIKKHGRPLLSWISDTDSKMACSIDESVCLHVDGGIYICHGCQYSSHAADFMLGDVNEIESLNEVLNKYDDFKPRSPECKDCIASFCNVCHITQVDSKNFRTDWLSCMSKNALRCKYFKYFGYAKNALELALLAE